MRVYRLVIFVVLILLLVELEEKELSGNVCDQVPKMERRGLGSASFTFTEKERTAKRGLLGVALFGNKKKKKEETDRDDENCRTETSSKSFQIEHSFEFTR